jgi:hypothetical protein
LYLWPLYPTSRWKAARGSLARTTIHGSNICWPFLSTGAWLAIVLGNDTLPQVTGKDRDKFDERNKEAIMLLKLSVTDEMLPKVQIGKNFNRDLEAFEKVALRLRTRVEPSS